MYNSYQREYLNADMMIVLTKAKNLRRMADLQIMAVFQAHHLALVENSLLNDTIMADLL